MPMRSGVQAHCAIIAGLAIGQAFASVPASGRAFSDKSWRVPVSNREHIQVLIERPTTPEVRAVLLPLPGDDGRLKFSPAGKIERLRSSFLVRTRRDFHLAGYVTALMDAPSDRQESPGLLAGYRASKVHATRDIGTVLATLKSTFAAPVFVIGNSRGAVSAANAARRAGQTFAGVALTSSITVPNRRGATLGSVMLEKVTIPTLFVHHTSDNCALTPLHGARASFERMQAAGAQVRWTTVTGGPTSMAPCKGQSHHGFWGTEGQAVGHIKTWVEKVLKAR